jgi:hypothetical protein
MRLPALDGTVTLLLRSGREATATVVGVEGSVLRVSRPPMVAVAVGDEVDLVWRDGDEPCGAEASVQHASADTIDLDILLAASWERRRTPRFRPRGTVLVDLQAAGVHLEGALVDVSLRGLRLRCGRPLATGERLICVLRDPASPLEVSVAGRVVGSARGIVRVEADVPRPDVLILAGVRV